VTVTSWVSLAFWIAMTVLVMAVIAVASLFGLKWLGERGRPDR
jgi:hypothetical protein